MKEEFYGSSLHIAIPILREYNWIKKLVESIENQTYIDYHVYFCINQPDQWWDDINDVSSCIDNQKTNEYIKQYARFPHTIIDRFSRGKGWENGKKGVGWARKTIYQEILKHAKDQDIIISLDADTVFGSTYFQTILNSFSHTTEKVALSVPYYHALVKDDNLNRQVLRYEIYLRSYFINLKLIDSPYAYTAIGSAMAFPVRAYRKVGGMKAYESGEDFYLMQKLRKMGVINLCLNECVYPSARFSDRVPFGTGPAMRMGSLGDWKKYPIFSMDSFHKIHKFYTSLPHLYIEDIETPLDRFFEFQFKDSSIWKKLRGSSNTEKQFVKKVHQKFDGLRILQFLKFDSKNNESSDEKNLNVFIQRLGTMEGAKTDIQPYNMKSLESLIVIRDILFKFEKKLRCQKIN